MSLLFRKRFVDVAAEATYGDDPGSGRVALLPRSDMSLEIQGQTLQNDTVRNTLSPRGHVITDKMASLNLPLNLRGAGLDGTDDLQVPETDVLLKASAMQREPGARLVLTSVTGDFERGEQVSNTTAINTVGIVADWDSANNVLYIRDLQNIPVASDSLTGDDSSAGGDVGTNSADIADAYVYRPSSLDPESQKSAYVRWAMDKRIHTIPGAMATFTLDMTRSQQSRITFNVSGFYNTPTDGGPISGTYLDQQPDRGANAQLILGGLDMTKVAVNSVTADIGASVEMRPDIQAADGYKQFMIVSREGTGSIDPDVADLTDFNPFIDWSAANEVAVAAEMGSGAGNRVRVVMPTTQYTSLPYTERNGIAAYNIGFRTIGNDDELMLIYS